MITIMMILVSVLRKVSAISKQWHCLQQVSLQEAELSETAF